MTDKEKLNRVIAEIKRLQQKVINGATSGQYSSETIREKNQLLVSLISFIDSMQEEPTIPDIVDEHYWEMLGEEPVSEDLEKAADDYAVRVYNDYLTNPRSFEEKDADELNTEAFIAGAQWQKQKDEKALNENALLYNARLEGIEIGKAEMKQQMMKEALDSTIVDDGLYKSIVPTMQAMLRYNKGDKVKIIIFKEDWL